MIHLEIGGEICLRCGIAKLTKYESPLSLAGIGDSVWVGAAYEGQCCAIARILQLEGGGPVLHRTGSQESLNSLSSEPDQRSLENITKTFRCAIGCMEKLRESTLIM